jgi:phosphate transport system substrate-binding protein
VATLRRLLDEPVPTLSAVLPEAGPELEAILKKALAREPADRFQSAQDMRDALLNYLVKTSQSCTQDEIADFMHVEFERAHQDLQVRIRRCMRASGEDADPERRAASDDVTLHAALDSGRSIPLLDSGAYGIDDGLDATEPGSRSARGKLITKAHPPPAATTVPPGQSASPRGRTHLLLVLVTLFVVAGVWLMEKRLKPTPPETRALQPAPTPEPEVLLRLCGSNTIGRELGPALAEGLLREKGLDQVSHRNGSRPYETIVRGMAPGKDRAQAIEILAEGSATAFTELGRSACDIGMASRRIKSEEADELIAKGLGDLRSPASEHVLGLDGIAVIVHPNNPIRSVDLSQLRRVFLGEITEFSAIGGPAGPIDIYARDDQSGTFDTFKHLVLGDSALAPTAKRFVDSESLSDAVAGDVHGIGFIGIVYVRNAKSIAVGEPGSVPLFPSTFTVTTEDYSLARRLYLYTPSQMSSPVTMDFVNFALSAEGQKIVKATGFIDLSVGLMNAKSCDTGCPPRYQELTQNAQRLSLDFRFRTGSADLDTRGLRDLDRLMLFLRQVPLPKLVLLGFSDGRGSPQQNLMLSRERAKKVEEELAARGVRASRVDALGQEMAIASNDTDAGREKNRRVEVWLEGAGR